MAPPVAEAVVAVERMCGEEGDLVGTVGRMDVRPGAVNVIPGEVSFSIDVRSSDDRIRQAKVPSLRRRIGAIGKRRNLRVGFQTLYETRSTHCAPQLMRQLADAVAQEGFRPVELTSGAGHDAVAMADLTSRCCSCDAPTASATVRRKPWRPRMSPPPPAFCRASSGRSPQDDRTVPRFIPGYGLAPFTSRPRHFSPTAP